MATTKKSNKEKKPDFYICFDIYGDGLDNVEVEYKESFLKNYQFVIPIFYNSYNKPTTILPAITIA